MPKQVAWTYLQGWTTQDDVRLSLDDWGVLQGAMVVDRLRTCRGQPLDVNAHVQRFVNGCQALGIALPRSVHWDQVIGDCVQRNQSAMSGQDFSVILLATPGRSDNGSAEPTLIAHPSAINWQRLHHWYSHGQPLQLAAPRNVPAACWDPHIKTRARLQYFLADSAVGGNNSSYPGAVLLDLDGCLTETSSANLMIVEQQRLVCPPEKSTLAGVSLGRTIRLASDAGLSVVREPIPIERAMSAQEILLCGTTGCLWPASSINDQIINDQILLQRDVFGQLSQLWIRDLGFDYMQQARELSP